MSQSQNGMQAILDAPFHCGALSSMHPSMEMGVRLNRDLNQRKKSDLGRQMRQKPGEGSLKLRRSLTDGDKEIAVRDGSTKAL